MYLTYVSLAHQSVQLQQPDSDTNTKPPTSCLVSPSTPCAAEDQFWKEMEETLAKMERDYKTMDPKDWVKKNQLPCKFNSLII